MGTGCTALARDKIYVAQNLAPKSMLVELSVLLNLGKFGRHPEAKGVSLRKGTMRRYVAEKCLRVRVRKPLVQTNY